MQVEPGGNSGGEQLRDFDSKYWPHYTYQFETMLDGGPCQPHPDPTPTPSLTLTPTRT